MVRRRRGRPRIPDEIQAEIERLAYLDVPSAEIHERLKRQFGEAVAPSLRTVQRLVAKSTPTEPSSPWSLADAEGDEAELILPVLASVIEATGGRRQHLTQAEVGWILRIRRAAPDLPVAAPELLLVAPLFWLVQGYMLRTEGGESTADLDAFLAFAPWRSGEPRQRYFEALRKGWATTSPFLDMVRARIIEHVVHEEEKEELRTMRRELGPAQKEDGDGRQAS